MPLPNTPIGRALAFAGEHSHALITDAQLGIRFGQGGLELVPADEPAYEDEEIVIAHLSLYVPVGTDLLRVPAILPEAHQDSGWNLEVSFTIFHIMMRGLIPGVYRGRGTNLPPLLKFG